MPRRSRSRSRSPQRRRGRESRGDLSGNRTRRRSEEDRVRTERQKEKHREHPSERRHHILDRKADRTHGQKDERADRATERKSDQHHDSKHEPEHQDTQHKRKSTIKSPNRSTGIRTNRKSPNRSQHRPSNSGSTVEGTGSTGKEMDVDQPESQRLDRFKSERFDSHDSRVTDGGDRGGRSMFPQRNNIDRGRDRVRDREWREDWGRGGRGRGRRGVATQQRNPSHFQESDGNDEEDAISKRLFESLSDPQDVPRLGFFYEHDDRDAPASSTKPQQQRRRTTSTSGGLDSRGRPTPHRDDRFTSKRSFGGGKERYEDRTRDRRVSPGRLRRHSSDERYLRRRRRSDDRDEGDEGDRRRERERIGQGRSNRGERERWERGGRERGVGGFRNRSPIRWKHDMFENEPQEEQDENDQNMSTAQDSADHKWGHDKFEEMVTVDTITVETEA